MLAVIAILAGLVWAGGTVRAASLVVDVETGQVIASDAPNHLWYPASLTKMMTVYVALSEIEAGRLSFDDRIKVSSYAAGAEPGEASACSRSDDHSAAGHQCRDRRVSQRCGGCAG